MSGEETVEVVDGEQNRRRFEFKVCMYLYINNYKYYNFLN